MSNKNHSVNDVAQKESTASLSASDSSDDDGLLQGEDEARMKKFVNNNRQDTPALFRKWKKEVARQQRQAQAALIHWYMRWVRKSVYAFRVELAKVLSPNHS